MARILLVEDNKHNQLLFLTALRHHGFEVSLVEDGECALTHVATEAPPDLVLLDLSLPKVDGWTVAKAIRADERAQWSCCPILALTAHAMKGDRERALDAGCDDYLSKPVSPRALIKQVQAMVASARAA